MPAATAKPKTYKLRGYVKERPDGRYIGVCLRPNLVVEAESQNAALDKLRALVEEYMQDAIEDDQLDHFMSQHAPAKFYLEYYADRLKALTHLLRVPFLAFSETRPLPRHA